MTNSLRFLLCTLVLVAAMGVVASPAAAQVNGVYRFQLQPFCNVLTLNVSQQGGILIVEGFDDQCDAARHTAVVGSGFLNADGSVAVGLTTVSKPGGAPVHLQATVHVASLSGPWSDSVGNQGGFVFTPAAGIGGARRGGESNGIAPNSITFDQLGVEVRNGLPPRDRFSFGEDGTFFIVDREAVNTGLPFSGFAWSAPVGLFTAGIFSPLTERSLGPTGTLGNGLGSWRGGLNPRGRGDYALAFGDHAQADGNRSIALGGDAVASGDAAAAIGWRVGACGDSSVALGSLAATSSAPVFVGGSLSDICAGTRYNNSFVFSDGSAATTANADGAFVVRASGGVTFFAGAPGAPGCKLNAGTGGWTCTSDRNMKTGFAALDGEDVLRKLAAMPVDSWSFIAAPSVRHVGPTAQDFHAAFGLGLDDTSIGYTDINGINMRAIQALEARTRELAAKTAEIDTLKERLSALEQVIIEITKR